MKITLPTSHFLEALGHVASVAGVKTPKPVLGCVILKADSDAGLILEGTDLDVGVRVFLADASILEPGLLVVPAPRLLSVIREIEDDEVTLVGEDDDLIVDTGGAHFRIRGEDPETRAILPEFPAEGSIVLSGSILRDMIRRTIFATPKEAGRYALMACSSR